MVTTTDLVSRGYLPKELPPLFTSASLGRHYANLALPSKKTSYCLRYSHSKYATVRRTLAIPNPAHFVPLAAAVATHWHTLSSHCGTSPFSHTKPIQGTDRAIVWENSLEQMPLLRAKMRVGARYVLQADVSTCYAAMYTHAIPWALHGKAAAKANRRTQSPGNILDVASRNIQSGQTIGIPIGPDTSLPIAEAVLTSVDRSVQTKTGCERAFRVVDDYEIPCATLSDAERVRNALQDELAEFELQLNPRKTRIIEVPSSLETAWVQELAAFPLGSPTSTVLEAQLVRYFSRAFDIANATPGDPVLKYAVRRLSEVDTKGAAVLAQHLLLQAAVSDPGTIQTALFVIFKHKQQGLNVDTDGLARALDAIIVRHAALQHAGDVAWALWGAVVFGLTLQSSATAALEKLNDPIAALMTLFAESKGALVSSPDKSQWCQCAQTDELFGP